MSDDEFDDELDAILRSSGAGAALEQAVKQSSVASVPKSRDSSSTFRTFSSSSSSLKNPLMLQSSKKSYPPQLQQTNKQDLSYKRLFPQSSSANKKTSSTIQLHRLSQLNPSGKPKFASSPGPQAFSQTSSNSGGSRSSSVSLKSGNKTQRDLFGKVVADSSDKSSQNTLQIRSSQKSQNVVSTPTHHELDYENLKSYIYPINYEIRDYQFNIIERCFYNNMLVALPTGLGKTFIAATIILNYWRWFPQSKIIFMAPTRPLVAQQIKACFNIIGLKDQSAVLLDKGKRNRLEIWNSFRIFFTTPQVVENDLCNGLVDPKSVSLLVIDEAHKAKGNYAYNNVVKFLNRFNNSYRTVALTATPSATVEGIKEIVLNLNINKIEIRTEKSIDIIKYFKRKRIDKIDVDFTDNDMISNCLIHLGNAAEPYIKMAVERHLIKSHDPNDLYAFKMLEIQRRNLMNNSLGEGLKWQNHFLIKLLLFIATAIKKLKIYGYNNFRGYFNDTRTKVLNSKNKMMIELFSTEATKALWGITSKVDNKGYGHPKVGILIEYIQNFFKTSSYENSKVIIFSEFRDSALEIVSTIESENNPNLKPHIFIGQAPDSNPDVVEKQSSKRSSSEDAQLKGMSQKIQKQVIKDFKGDKYNILVATSIGEEGLDIGEVDLIVCYDTTASPIKNIQRLGRTGRKRDGNILMLFSDNERSKFDKAMDNYEWIQKYIVKNEPELVCESQKNRIIPSTIKPILEKKFIVPEEIDVDDNDEIIKLAVDYMKKGTGKATTKTKSKVTAPSKGKKTQSKIEKRFFMPDNVTTGFQSVSDLLKKAPKQKASEPSPPSLPELIDTEFLSESSLFADKSGNQESSGKIAPVGDILTSDLHSNSSPAPIQQPDEFTKQTELGPMKDLKTNIPTTDDFGPLVMPGSLKIPEASDRSLSASPLPNKASEMTGFSDFESDFEDFDDLDTRQNKQNLQKNTDLEPKSTLDEKSPTVSNFPVEKIGSKDQSKPEILVSNKFDPQDGLLSSQEKIQLYTNYYTPVSPVKEYFAPIPSAIRPLNSKKTKRFVDLMQNIENLDPQQAKAQNKLYIEASQALDDTKDSCIKYLNNHLR